MKIITDSKLKASKIDRVLPYFFAKRIFDFCFSLLILIVLSPLIILIYILAKAESIFYPASRGPFFYQETRISQGRPFTFYKIRIFKTAALGRAFKKDGIIHTKPLEQNIKNLTYAGRLLKKFYLDELPQIFNILKGEMSFVGTRPWNPHDYRRETSEGIYRKKIVKAGLTGLVQLYKGCHREFPGGDQGLDDYYIAFCRRHNRARIMLFDLEIILRSFLKILKGEGL
jgi:lipopolysaccharide/colanic/teichoic acid biosynthesis glycosyltransferase